MAEGGDTAISPIVARCVPKQQPAVIVAWRQAISVCNAGVQHGVFFGSQKQRRKLTDGCKRGSPASHTETSLHESRDVDLSCARKCPIAARSGACAAFMLNTRC